MCVLQAADFADRARRGPLRQLCLPKSRDFGRNMLTPSGKSRPPTASAASWGNKVATLEGERTELRRQLAEERKEANEALAKAQSAQAEANLARAEGSLARQRAEELEERLNALQTRVERAEASTRSEAERTRK
jgi:chromosome segregation ATPase